MLHVVTGRKKWESAWRETEPLRCTKQIIAKYYSANMEPFGNETLKKIARHREMRKDKGFDTLERYVDLKGTAEMLTDRPAVLLECMSNLTANEIYRPDGSREGHRGQHRGDGAKNLCRCEHAVIVVPRSVFEWYWRFSGYDPV